MGLVHVRKRSELKNLRGEICSAAQETTRYISILPAIPVTLYLHPQEALEVRHPQEASRYQPFLAASRGTGDTGAQPEHTARPQGHQDVTLYKVAALGLASGIILVLLLFCLYRVFCPKNYGQNGHGRRRRGDLPCDDYGYSPPETEIVPLVLRGHLMDIECLASDGMLLVSCCLVGQIRVWDAQTGDCLTVIPKPRLRRDSSGIFDYQDGWDQSPEGKGGLEDSLENGHQLKRLLCPAQPPLFCDQPDLTSLIDTNFSERVKAAESEPRLRHRDTGYDFSSLVGKVYEEHGSSGCRNVWDAIEGTLHSSNEEGQSGITALVFLNNRIVAARLNGSLDFFSLETHTALNHLQFRGGPGRSSVPVSPVLGGGAVVLCQLTHSVPCAHHKPITALKAAAGRLVTGSQDHTLRELGCGASLGVISDNVLVTGGQGCVSFWDIGYGDLLQTVYLGKSNEAQPARQILVLDNAAIVCNFGSELSLLYVPSVLEKLD
ncbi:hypothetical protein WISP_29539 [Willisornis vidua]|uniref:SCAP beta-propeller domain-containing protein n=1 Tax=Willisornis vidua TaxID=1566151 RepID=A0ABQ9DKK2_9PASS|nr:hypothetical protein WISP_29539 [Willisornis vidua]